MIRPYTPQDVPVMARLFSETIRSTCRRDYTPEQIEAWSGGSSRPEWAGRFARSHTVVAVERDDIVGYGNIESDGHLDNLYVAADCVRTGIGSMIYAALETHARHSGAGNISTEASTIARPFFEKHGFALADTRVVESAGVAFEVYCMTKALTTPVERTTCR